VTVIVAALVATLDLILTGALAKSFGWLWVPANVLIGAGTSLFTGRNAAFSALRQFAIGLAAAGVTYGVGAIAGVLLG